MHTNTPLEEALALALRLTPKERLQLIERIALSVKAEIEDFAFGDSQPEIHWGKSVGQLMDDIGPIEMKYPEIEDPVVWVKHLRAEERRRRLANLL
jgi:hypothetical protein